MNGIVEMDVASARRLTERIRLIAMTVGESIDKLKALVAEARASEAHIALGYVSWTAYLADVLGETPMRLERDVRQALVAELSEQGMSTRAIAPIVGVGVGTVHRDIEASRVPNGTPAESVSSAAGSAERAEAALDAEFDPTPTLPPRDDDWIPADPQTGEVIEPTTITETHTVKTVIGLDGKTYTPKPAAPRRNSIIDDARNAGWQLRKAIERLERIKSDDRYQKNKVEILAALQPHLDFATETITGL